MANVSMKSTAGAFDAYLSAPRGTSVYPGIVLIEEIWGVDEHIRYVADRLAKEGFIVLAPELIPRGMLEKITPDLKENLHNPERRNELQPIIREAMMPIRQPEFAQEAIQKLRACVDYLLAHAHSNGKAGSWGFCFGGTMSFHLAINDPRLDACAVYYGMPPNPVEQIKVIACPVLVMYGEKDTNIVSSVPALKAAADEYDKDFEFVAYPNVGHAFFNDTNRFAYDERVAKDAWQKTIAFLQKNLHI